VGYLLVADSHLFTCRTWADLAARLVWARGGFTGRGSLLTVALPLPALDSSGKDAKCVRSLPPGGVRLLHPGNGRLGSDPSMPAIAHMVCHACGAHSEGPASPRGSLAARCRCGGIRQVVRIVRHSGGAAPASLAELERSVQERASDETLTPTRKVQ
jgi:hypothetical protein